MVVSVVGTANRSIGRCSATDDLTPRGQEGTAMMGREWWTALGIMTAILAVMMVVFVDFALHWL